MSHIDLQYRLKVRELIDTVNINLRRNRRMSVELRRMEIPNKHFRRVQKYRQRYLYLRYSRFQMLMEASKSLLWAFNLYRKQKMVLVWKPASVDVTAELTKLVSFHDLFLQILKISNNATHLTCKYRDYKRLRRIQKRITQITGFSNEEWNLHLNNALHYLLLFVSTTMK